MRGTYLGQDFCDRCHAGAIRERVWALPVEDGQPLRLCAEHWEAATGEPVPAPRTAEGVPPEPVPARPAWIDLGHGWRAAKSTGGHVRIEHTRDVEGVGLLSDDVLDLTATQWMELVQRLCQWRT